MSTKTIVHNRVAVETMSKGHVINFGKEGKTTHWEKSNVQLAGGHRLGEGSKGLSRGPKSREDVGNSVSAIRPTSKGSGGLPYNNCPVKSVSNEINKARNYNDVNSSKEPDSMKRISAKNVVLTDKREIAFLQELPRNNRGKAFEMREHNLKEMCDKKGIDLNRLLRSSRYTSEVAGVHFDGLNSSHGINSPGTSMIMSQDPDLNLSSQSQSQEKERTVTVPLMERLRNELSEADYLVQNIRKGSRKNKSNVSEEETTRQEQEQDQIVECENKDSNDKNVDEGEFPDDSFNDSMLIMASQMMEEAAAVLNKPGTENEQVPGSIAMNTPNSPFPFTSTPNENVILPKNQGDETPRTTRNASGGTRRRTVNSDRLNNGTCLEENITSGNCTSPQRKLLKFDESPIINQHNKSRNVGTTIATQAKVSADIFGEFEEDDDDTLFNEIEMPEVELPEVKAAEPDTEEKPNECSEVAVSKADTDDLSTVLCNSKNENDNSIFESSVSELGPETVEVISKAEKTHRTRRPSMKKCELSQNNLTKKTSTPTKRPTKDKTPMSQARRVGLSRKCK